MNACLVDDVLVDAGTPAAARRILRQLRDRQVGAHVVTHAHPDHFGSSHAVCEALGVPLWTGLRDAEAIETAGIGKTRLVDEARALAKDRGFVRMQATGDELEPPPLGPMPAL
nr:MBL fold metallo-hydrolase [Kribbella catacumbae]